MAQLVETLRYKTGGVSSIYIVVTEFFLTNYLTVGSTQLLTEMNTRVISYGGKGLRLRNLPSSCSDFLEIWGASTSWGPKG